MEFETFNLTDLYTISSGLSKNRKYFGTGTPFLTFKDVFDNLILPNEFSGQVITEEKEREKYSVKKGDLFLTRTSEKQNELGISAVALKDYKNATFNGFTKRLRPNKYCENKLLPVYAAFYFRSNNFRNQVNSMSIMSTRASLNNEMISKLKITIPSLQNQMKISHILLALLKKEKINQKIIANLEELSQTIFKHWFVDFEFPDENGNPYKSSGGEMVDSELGKIPKGWECVYLKDIVHHKKDTFNPKKSNESEVKHFSLPAFDSGQYPTIDYVTDIKSNKWIIDENCILFSKMNPTTRRIWVTLYNENFLNVASSEFVVLKSDSSYRNAFIYNICISDKFNEYLVSNTTGSTNSRQRVKPDIAVQYRFAYNEEVSYLLSEKIEPYIEKIKIIREQNQNLTQLRDTLLPKLMSGEIEIPDDIEVNEDELSI
ncbi:restriction endonuclease subunit S [Staphylococcus pseudintermedius]|uniref:restriction endonuclease subunit S n=1 Tax=Staphylococcus pseudintermedius TaxID=283734 RepID=UPI002883EB31|nr:restriction endonuclease subunit S [Staphylococcus pseudintermedius]MDT0867077.1 restriction endonuclease subunit S [Staphylococcus pseudintermedius]